MMKLKKCLLLICLTGIQIPVNADDINHKPLTRKEGAGLSIGTLIGGLLAGPPGAIVGALGGTYVGARESETDRKIISLEKQLNAKSIELAYRQNELANTKARYEKEFQKVVHNKNIRSLEKLSQGISYVIYYKTDDTEIRRDIRPQIRSLAELIKPFPQIQVNIEGYADHRGTEKYNLALSKKRIDKVRQEFINAGISTQRLQSQAFGEKKAQAKQGDHESYMFDRRVRINLTLDRKV